MISQADIPNQGVCPNCGRCPTCGRSNGWYPNYWNFPQVTCNTNTGTVLGNSASQASLPPQNITGLTDKPNV
jgi:hypothetical protein